MLAKRVADGRSSTGSGQDMNRANFTMSHHSSRAAFWAILCCILGGIGAEVGTVVCKDAPPGYNSPQGCHDSTKSSERHKCLFQPCYASDSDSSVMQRLPTENLPWLKRFTSPSSTVSIDPNYVVGKWGECSASCGKGTRRRKVECQILLEFSQTIATLPDSHCLGPKPLEIEYCFVPCADEFEQSTYQNESSNKINFGNKLPKSLESAALALSSTRLEPAYTYSWRSAGFTQCSASCLGGTQESIIQCVRDADLEVSSPYLCDINEKPDSITRTCNDHPCPPRWNISEYLPCSKSCGGGVQVREINCIHEVTRGSENTLVVSDDRCPRPPPRSKKFCNVFDCPARWKPEVWSKCPKSCGGGMKTRKLKCIKELAFGQIQEQPPSRCPRKKPRTTKICNKKACKRFSKHHESKAASNTITSNDLVYVQKEPMKRVSVKAGGKAVIFKGTTLKIRCPQRSSQNKSFHVAWFKDGSRIKPSKKHHITSRGALRIRQISYAEAGVYTCAVGHVKTSIQIMVKPPINKYSSEESSRENPTPNAPSFNWNAYSRNKMLTTKDNEIDSEVKRPEAITTFNREANSYQVLNSISTESPSTTTRLIVDFAKEDFARAAISELNTDSSEMYGKTSSSTTTAAAAAAATTDPLGTGDGMARSSATSHHQAPISQLQQLLSNLRHTFQATNLNFKHNSHSGASEKSSTTPTKPTETPIAPQVLVADSVVLGKGSPENLHFDWIISDWSSCSQPCGGSGFQVRASQCLVRFNNVSKRVDENLCVDVGLDPPLTIRECGLEECPDWKPSEWSRVRTFSHPRAFSHLLLAYASLLQCADCRGLQSGVQIRKVACILPNGTELGHEHCNKTTKPTEELDCLNKHCRPTWITGDWSECTGQCDEEGFQSRLLRCVWYKTEKPADKLCDALPRPPVMRSCHNYCAGKNTNCIDRSNHCSLAKALNMCRIAHYRRHCCATCRQENELDTEVFLDRDKRGHSARG